MKGEDIDNDGTQNNIEVEIDASFPTLTYIPYGIHNMLSEYLLATLVTQDYDHSFIKKVADEP
jgi:hypothetical protein